MQFEQYYKQFEPMIYAVMRKLNIFTEHEEYYQIGLIAIWQALEKYDGASSGLSNYIYRTIYYDMIEEIRRQSRKQKFEQTQDEIPELYLNPSTDQQLFISQLLNHLDKEERLIIYHYYFNSLKDEEIANLIGKKTCATKKKRQRIINKLKRLIIKTKNFEISV